MGKGVSRKSCSAFQPARCCFCIVGVNSASPGLNLRPQKCKMEWRFTPFPLRASTLARLLGWALCDSPAQMRN